MNRRYEHAATVLTSNKGFEQWGEVFGDDVMAAALIDRVLHHCHLVNIEGNSYRMREHTELYRALQSDVEDSTEAVRSPRRSRPTSGSARLSYVCTFEMPDPCSFWPALTVALTGISGDVKGVCISRTFNNLLIPQPAIGGSSPVRSASQIPWQSRTYGRQAPSAAAKICCQIRVPRGCGVNRTFLLLPAGLARRRPGLLQFR